MPLVRISLRKGKPSAHGKAIGESVYRALREIFEVPEHDKFVVIDEYDADHMLFEPNFLNIPHSSDLVILQLTVSNTRTREKKIALYRKIVELLAQNAGVKKEDVFINLVEVQTENWSFGNGIAQYVE